MLNDEKSKLSYALGMNVVGSIAQQGFVLEDIDAFCAAIKDGATGNAPQITPEEANTLLMGEVQRQQEAKNEAHAGSIEAGKKFLDENAAREEVTALASGLQYEVMTEGTGEKPTFNSQVTTHYHGTLVDGRVFDSSVERGQPASFGVGQVIKGWTEALQLMNTGSKWKLTIPGELAYGANGAGDMIGPHETLIFEVELLSIDA